MDEFILDQEDQGHAHWVATLSNGHEMTQDDNRPGLVPWQAWVRLHAHCQRTGLSVVSLRLRFRDNSWDELPALNEAEGFYFCRSVGKDVNSPECVHSYCVGYLDGDEVSIWRVNVPELITFTRFSLPAKGMREELIRNRAGK